VLSAGIFLIVNGIVLYIADGLVRRQGKREIVQLSYLQVAMVAQTARFSFLFATPIIFGAAVLEVPKALKAHGTHLPRSS